MTTTQIEIAKKRLFDAKGLNVGNIKMFPGNGRDVTPEQMAEQINRALSQIEAGDVEFVDSFDD